MQHDLVGIFKKTEPAATVKTYRWNSLRLDNGVTSQQETFHFSVDGLKLRGKTPELKPLDDKTNFISLDSTK